MFNCYLIKQEMLRVLTIAVTQIIHTCIGNTARLTFKKGVNFGREVLCKKDVPRNFKIFTGKQLCWSLFSNKVAVLRHLCLSEVSFILLSGRKASRLYLSFIVRKRK